MAKLWQNPRAHREQPHRIVRRPAGRTSASSRASSRHRPGWVRQRSPRKLASAELLMKDPTIPRISLVVVHGISLPPGEFGGDGIVRLFTNRLDPAAHPYYADDREPARLVALRDPPRRPIVQFVSCTSAPGTPASRAWRGVRALQRLLDRHRARRHRRPAVRAGAIHACWPAPPRPRAPLSHRRCRRPQRHRARTQDRSRPGLRLDPAATRLARLGRGGCPATRPPVPGPAARV